MDGEGGSRKRVTERTITKEDCNDQVEDAPGNFERATEAELKTRHIRRVKRPPLGTTDDGKPNPFAGISLTTPVETKSDEGKESEPSEQLVEKNEEVDQKPVAEPPQPSSDQKTPEQPNEDAKESEEVDGNTANGEFGKSFFDKPPAFSDPAPSQGSSDVATQFKPLDVVHSGEESEKTVYLERAALFSNSEGAWKPVGRGEVKVNVDKDGAARLIMRQSVTFRLLLNARLYPEMKLVPMGESAISFTCQNSVVPIEKLETDQSEKKEEEDIKYSILALRFKTDAKRKIESFVEMVEKHKNATSTD